MWTGIGTPALVKSPSRRLLSTGRPTLVTLAPELSSRSKIERTADDFPFGRFDWCKCHPSKALEAKSGDGWRARIAWGRPCLFPPRRLALLANDAVGGSTKWARLATSRQISVFPPPSFRARGPASCILGGGEQVPLGGGHRGDADYGAKFFQERPTIATSQRGWG